MLNNLPAILSGEQVRTVLHISKRKCAWMLNNGFIKCQNTGKMTRKYTVLKEDLLTYIEDSQKHPEKYVTPYAEFSAAKYTTTHKPRPCKLGFPSSLPVSFRVWIELEFEQLPDTFTIPQVITITGYSENSVKRWICQGYLKFVKTQNTKIIAKDWLIDFYCTYGYKISRMSDRHLALMKRFFGENK